MDWKFIYNLRSTSKNVKQPGLFFKGNFSLLQWGDTFFDISEYTKGIVWINGHNLGVIGISVLKNGSSARHHG